MTCTCSRHRQAARRVDRAREQMRRAQTAAGVRAVERQIAEHASYIEQLRARPADELTGGERLVLAGHDLVELLGPDLRAFAKRTPR